MRDRTHKIIRGGVSVGGAQLIVQACGIVRNLVVARLISPADFGVAAVLAMSVSFVELLSDLGTGRFLIQARDGADPGLLASSHTITVLRGAAAACALLLLSGRIASLFGMPDAVRAFRAIALVPLIRGFTHNDIWVLQRAFSYRAIILWELIPQLAVVILAFPLGWWFHDYWALLCLLVGNVLLMTITSHLVTERAYRLGYNRVMFSRFMGFGWPFLIDGILVFAVLQGERIVIGRHFPREILGGYSAAYLLTWGLMYSIAKVSGSLGFPYLCENCDDLARFNFRYRLLMEGLLVVALILLSSFALAGTAIMSLVYGSKYMVSAGMITAMACTQSLRVLRLGPVLGSTALGNTRIPMLANLVAIPTLALAWGVAHLHSPIVLVVATGTAGELVSLVTCGILISRRHGVELSVMLRSVLWTVSVLSVCIGSSAVVFTGRVGLWPSLAVGLLGSTVIAVISGSFCAGLRGLTIALVGKYLGLRPQGTRGRIIGEDI